MKVQYCQRLPTQARDGTCNTSKISWYMISLGCFDKHSALLLVIVFLSSFLHSKHLILPSSSCPTDLISQLLLPAQPTLSVTGDWGAQIQQTGTKWKILEGEEEEEKSYMYENKKKGVMAKRAHREVQREGQMEDGEDIAQ